MNPTHQHPFATSSFQSASASISFPSINMCTINVVVDLMGIALVFLFVLDILEYEVVTHGYQLNQMGRK